MVRLCFQPVIRGRRHLVLRYGVDDLRFSTTYWYDDVDFVELEARYGDDAMRKVYFHLLAFEANKAASLAPTKIDAGPYADLVTDSFWDLWETLFHNVWGVWRLENDLPDYRLPRPPAAGSRPTTAAAIDVDDGTTELLMLCGGGKDSLVAMRLLERAGIELRRVRLLPLHLRAGASASTGWSTDWWRTASRGGCTGPGCSTTRWTRRSRPPIRSSASAGSSPPRRSARTGRRCRSPSSTASPRSPSASPGAPTSTTSCGTRPARRSTTCGG